MNELIKTINSHKKYSSLKNLIFNLDLFLFYENINAQGLYDATDNSILINENIYKSEFEDYVLAHEIAHHFQFLHYGKDWIEFANCSPSQALYYECEAELLSCYILKIYFPNRKIKVDYTFDYMFGGRDMDLNNALSKEVGFEKEKMQKFKAVRKSFQPKIKSIKNWLLWEEDDGF